MTSMGTEACPAGPSGCLVLLTSTWSLRQHLVVVLTALLSAGVQLLCLVLCS
jgi:hypothetical protein